MVLGTLLATAVGIAFAAPAAAEDAKASKSSVQAAALAKQLAQAKLQYICHRGSRPSPAASWPPCTCPAAS